MNTPETHPVPIHLLVVDDDRLVLSTLASGLRHAGYRISTAESVEDAEAFLAEGTLPDLVILDVQMPQSDGLTLAERLREFDHIPFIMFSAFSEAQMVDKATAKGALGYMVKPLDIHQMLPSIQAALARAGEMRSLKATGIQLQNALTVERDISVAVGITMMQYRLGRSEAFSLLREASRSQRRKLADLARGVVDSVQVLHKV